MDKTSKMSVGEKTERARNFDRIFELLFGNVRLADESNRRHRPALELSFDSGECDRLVIANHLGLLVAGWESNQERCDQAHERSSAQIKSGLDWMKIAPRVERSDRSNDKRAGHNRRQLVMRELHERPRIQQIGAHAGDA